MQTRTRRGTRIGQISRQDHKSSYNTAMTTHRTQIKQLMLDQTSCDTFVNIQTMFGIDRCQVVINTATPFDDIYIKIPNNPKWKPIESIIFRIIADYCIKTHPLIDKSYIKIANLKKIAGCKLHEMCSHHGFQELANELQFNIHIIYIWKSPIYREGYEIDVCKFDSKSMRTKETLYIVSDAATQYERLDTSWDIILELIYIKLINFRVI